jgi:hypothetical protein
VTVAAEIKKLSDRLRASQAAHPSRFRMQRASSFDEMLDAEPTRTRKLDTDLPANAGPDTPLRLDVAAKLAFPDGGITAASLRREASAGRLVIERIAGKDFTTLTHIENMRREAATCRDGVVKVRASGLNRRNAGAGELSDRQHGSSATVEREKSARAALEMTAKALNENLPTTSPASTKRRARAVVIPLKS